MSRFLLSLLILVALLLTPTAAFAQDDLPPVNCGDLAEEDCDFLTQSRDAMLGLSSYAAAVNIDASLANLPNLPADLSWSIASDGRFQVDPELVTQLAALQNAQPEDPMAMFAEIVGLMGDIYTDTAFDLTLDLSISRDIARLLSAQAGIPVPTALTLPMRMVDGFLYLNADDLAEWLGVEGWLGVDIATAMASNMDQALEQMEENDLLSDPAATDMILNNIQMNQQIQQMTKDFVSVERLDDATLDGADVAQFLFTFDLAGFVSSPEFVEILMQQIEMQMEMQSAMGQEAPPVSEADIQAAADMLPMLAPMLLSGMEWNTVTSIGLEDMYVYQSESSISWDLGMVAAMAGAMASGGSSRPSPEAERATFTLDMRAVNSQFNEEMEIEAPEDAQIIPLDDMQSMPAM